MVSFESDYGRIRGEVYGVALAHAVCSSVPRSKLSDLKKRSQFPTKKKNAKYFSRIGIFYLGVAVDLEMYFKEEFEYSDITLI